MDVGDPTVSFKSRQRPSIMLQNAPKLLKVAFRCVAVAFGTIPVLQLPHPHPLPKDYSSLPTSARPLPKVPKAFQFGIKVKFGLFCPFPLLAAPCFKTRPNHSKTTGWEKPGGQSSHQQPAGWQGDSGRPLAAQGNPKHPE